MRTYHQLTQTQRYQIYALRKTKHTLQEIADVVGVHKSTVSRELRRNQGKRGYRPQQAHEMALKRRPKAIPRITEQAWKAVEKLLKRDWSLEQISGRLDKEQSLRISHEWIYQHIWSTNEQMVTCTNICVVKRNVANAMEPMIGGVNCLIAILSKTVQALWRSENVWEIGKWTPSLAEGTSKPW
jgi:IS30 family transposase